MKSVPGHQKEQTDEEEDEATFTRSPSKQLYLLNAMFDFVHGQPELALRQTSAAVFAAVQRLGLAFEPRFVHAPR